MRSWAETMALLGRELVHWGRRLIISLGEGLHLRAREKAAASGSCTAPLTLLEGPEVEFTLASLTF